LTGKKNNNAHLSKHKQASTSKPKTEPVQRTLKFIQIRSANDFLPAKFQGECGSHRSQTSRVIIAVTRSEAVGICFDADSVISWGGGGGLGRVWQVYGTLPE